ncbi:uncharacterized protein LOC135835434 [Planococcus citri]|uniref:uncharacterized protein LOC135835434 n=1 Tax=Planococcus citri TaxID=170843 RepID=UPI0031F9DDC7
MHFRKCQSNLLKQTLLKQTARRLSVVDFSVASEFVEECVKRISSEHFDFKGNVESTSDFLRDIIKQTNGPYQRDHGSASPSQEQLLLPEGEAPASPSPPPVLPPPVSPEPSIGSSSPRFSLESSSSGEHLDPSTVPTSSSFSSSPPSMVHSMQPMDVSMPLSPSSSAEGLGASSESLYFANPVNKEELAKRFEDVLRERFGYLEESARKDVLTQIICWLRLLKFFSLIRNTNLTNKI